MDLHTKQSFTGYGGLATMLMWKLYNPNFLILFLNVSIQIEMEFEKPCDVQTVTLVYSITVETDLAEHYTRFLLLNIFISPVVVMGIIYSSLDLFSLLHVFLLH